ncbi:hypothetical protein GCM10010387_45230 [Streptomyces inusitatus]|uniref:Uncharacterized protein n=1 Tax=Streptomyces inusitatus TaxID=68221 RepID=A0A918QHF1_9ACTN|nr:hypothetical protein [Streptomyces inusitatus]GGZ45676.1 hypothetical protein GCM10010387_45230 [Streptomyces inusitatus]
MTHSGQGDDRGGELPPETAGPWAPRGAGERPGPADGQQWGQRPPEPPQQWGPPPGQSWQDGTPYPAAPAGPQPPPQPPQSPDDWYGVRSQPLPPAQPFGQGPSDATQVIPPVGPGPSDATQIIPPVGAGPLPGEPPGHPAPSPFGLGPSDATQVIPPVGAGPVDATQVIPPVGAEPVDATQVIPPVGPGALPPESPAESTAYLGAHRRRDTPPVPPPPPGAPYGIRPGAPGDRPPPAEFDNLFRTGEGAPQPVPQQQFPPPRPLGTPPPRTPQPRGAGEGSHRRAQRRTAAPRRRMGAPVVAAVVVGCAVLGLGVGALMFGGDDGEKDPASAADPATASAPPSTAPSAAPSTSTAPPAEDPVKTQAKALDLLLADSNDSRAAVIRSVANIRQCKNLGQAAADLRAAAEQRRSLVTRLGGLDIGELPESEDLAESLTEAWQASASADDHYAAWADQTGRKKGCKNGKARNTSRAAEGNSASGEATEAKQEAAALWNPIAAAHGLPRRGSHQL